MSGRPATRCRPPKSHARAAWSRAVGRRLRKPRKPFDWLTTYRGRRGALQLVRRAIREGRMDDLEQGDRRDQLIAALGRLPLDRMEDRESLGVCAAYLDMLKSNIDLAETALEAEIAAYR